MGLCRLLLIVGLIASAAASTMAAQSNAPACDLGAVAVALTLVRYSQTDPDVRSFPLSPTAQCCEAPEASLPAQQEEALPCLWRAAADPCLITASLLALHRRALDFANLYCEVGKTTAACRAASFGTRLSRFCVIDTGTARRTSAAGLTSRPPYLCCVAAEPQLPATGINITDGCGGRHLFRADECQYWHLPAPVLTHQGATKAAVLAPTLAASASCAPRTLALSIVPYVLRDSTVRSCKDLVGGVPCMCHTAVEYTTIGAALKATDVLAIYNSCGRLRLGGADHKAAAAAACEGTTRTISKDPAKYSPLADSRMLAEIFTAVMTALFFWAAYKRSFSPIAFTRKNFGNEERALESAHAQSTLHGLQPLDAKLLPEKAVDNELRKQRAEVPRWQHSLFWVKRIFSTSEQRSNRHVPVHHLSRNHHIGYSTSHYVHRKEITRFIITVIILLYTVIHPVQAVPPVQVVPRILNVDLSFKNGQGFIQWSHDINVLGTAGSQYELRRHGIPTMKLLEVQTLEDQPPAWINATVRDEDDWASFIFRTDNYYINAYQNIRATHAVTEAIHFFPGSVDIGFDGTYKGLNGERVNLRSLNLNEDKAKDDLRILSRYRHGVDDPFPMKVALTRYVIMLAEAQRFTEVYDCIKDGWETECHLQRPDVLFVSWQVLSCGILENWEPNRNGPNPRSRNWLRGRKQTYKNVREALGITKEQAPGLLRVLIRSNACQYNMQDVVHI